MGLLACSVDEPEPSPYGFASAPEQRFRLETEEETQVDGDPAAIQRYADFRLVAESPEPGRHEIVLYLERYYVRVDGAPGGTSEIALSDMGLAVSSPGGGTLRLSPDDMRPGGGRLEELLRRPVGGCELTASGELVSQPWNSADPILSGLQLLDWVLLGFPVLGNEQEAAWSGRRRVPPLGQYRLGIDLPLRYERLPSEGNGEQRVRFSGLIQRSDLQVAPDLLGTLKLDLRAQADVTSEGRLKQAQLEFVMRFEADSGSLVSTRHRTRIRCQDCEGAVNFTPEGPDNATE